MDVAAVGLHEARLDVVAQVDRQYVVAQASHEGLVFDGEEHLDAPVQVARHEVGAAHQHFFGAAVAKPVDAAVFEEPADDAGHLDVVAHAGNAGPQRAHAAHQQVDLHARLGGPVEDGDHLAVDERVHLEHEVAAAARELMLDLAFEQCFEAVAQVDRPDEELLVVAGAREAGEEVEELGRVLADDLVAGEQVEVGVEARGHHVVVAGAEVHVAPDAVAFAAHHHADLGVRLDADQAIDHVDALVFERSRPLDVTLFVEARLELEQHGDLFAVARRLEQRGHRRGVAADAVERHLDGQHVGVVGRAFEPVDDRLERVVRAVDEDVVLADRGEDAEVGVVEAPGHGRHERRVFEVGTVEAQQVDAAHAQGRRHGHQALGLEIEVVEQDAAYVVGGRGVDRQAHHRTEPAAQDALLDGLEQVVGFELLDGHLGVARDPEGVDADDRHAGEQLV